MPSVRESVESELGKVLALFAFSDSRKNEIERDLPASWCLIEVLGNINPNSGGLTQEKMLISRQPVLKPRGADENVQYGRINSRVYCDETGRVC